MTSGVLLEHTITPPTYRFSYSWDPNS